MTEPRLKCPRTAALLTSLRIGGIEVDVCEDCGGLWLDRFEIAKFDRPEMVLGDALAAHLDQFPPPVIDHSVRIRCPRHPSTVMLRRRYSAALPIEVDECPQCGGVWLDADELDVIRGSR